MISFIHRGGSEMASYRYRVQIPAKELGFRINDISAETLIFAKPLPPDIELARTNKGINVVDICDDHLGTPLYQEMMHLAHIITCPTEDMQQRIGKYSYYAHIVPDTYEFEEKTPHCHGTRLIWFGHKLNLYSLVRILPDIEDYELRVVSNAPGSIPWSVETTQKELDNADIAIFPATKTYKSPNRVLEAIRRGCFVVAEYHPSLEEFDGIWVGDIRQGIEFAQNHPEKANSWTRQAQQFIKNQYSPKIQASAWRKALGLDSTLDLGDTTGKGGSMSILRKLPISDVTLES